MVVDIEAGTGHQGELEVTRIFCYKISLLAVVELLDAEGNLPILICDFVKLGSEKVVVLVVDG